MYAENCVCLMITHISTDFYFNDQIRDKVSLFSCCCRCYCCCCCCRVSYDQFNQFSDQNDWIKQEKVTGYGISRLPVWPSSLQQKKCHPFGVTPPTPGHKINQPFHGTLSMTKYADKWLQFLTSKVPCIYILSLRKCTQNKALLHKCAEVRKI